MSTRNIVVLGASSYAGISAAHFFLRKIRPSLPEKQQFKLILVDQSSHFWARNSAPRAIVTEETVPDKDKFKSTTDAFAQYDSSLWTFQQGTVQAVDTEARTVTVQPSSETSDRVTIEYYSLVIATGTKTPTPLTSIHSDHLESIKALQSMRSRLSQKPSSVVIAGGGPIGVETAGEVGKVLNGVVSSGSNPKTKIILLAGGSRLLPVLGERFSPRAEQLLQRFGVEVRYGADKRVTTVAEADGRTVLTLQNGETLETDVYIPAIGATPNTTFLPASLLDAQGYVETGKDLRVAAAGPRVYCVGDAGNYTKGAIHILYDVVPVLGANMAVDLGSTTIKEKTFKGKLGETQLVTVGPDKGLGAVHGWKVPGFVVSMFKGKDFVHGEVMKLYDGRKW